MRLNLNCSLVPGTRRFLLFVFLPTVDCFLPSTNIFAAMHIAVDVRYRKTAVTEEEQYTLALFYKLIQSCPEHHFTIITLASGVLPELPNATEYITATSAKNYFSLRRWNRKTFPAILNQVNADVYIGINSATAGTTIPQIIFMSSPDAVEMPVAPPFLLLLYKKYLLRQIAKANAIATFTGLQQMVIEKHFKTGAGQVTAVGYVVPPLFMPASWEQKEIILENHSGGCEYFLYTGSFTEDRFLLLLKAFSLFKKRQLSSMQLIAAGPFTSGNDVAEKLQTYKYRADVKLYENADLQTMATLTTAAYAVISLDEKKSTAFPVAAALQCGVPVISVDSANAAKAIAGPAGLYASQTPESLAEQMKLVYKDENLRMQLVANAAIQLPFVNGDAAVQKLWNCIDTAAAKIRLHLPPETEPEI